MVASLRTVGDQSTRHPQGGPLPHTAQPGRFRGTAPSVRLGYLSLDDASGIPPPAFPLEDSPGAGLFLKLKDSGADAAWKVLVQLLTLNKPQLLEKKTAPLNRAIDALAESRLEFESRMGNYFNPRFLP